VEARAPQLQPLFRHHVRRPRLTRLLEGTHAQAIVLLAPAGYGKTTLAIEWLSERPNVGWFRASSGSADVAAFSQGIAAAVRSFIPHAGDRLAERARATAPSDAAVRPLAELLAEDFADWPRDTWLVIDDYHLVSESAHVEELLDWLLTLTPMRVLVTTRRRPSWASARRVLYGELKEISRDELVMTRDEAADVLAGRSDDAIRRIVAQARGWPVLLGLASLSGGSSLPDDLPNRALFRYFAEEVFRHQRGAVRRFMLMASVPIAIDPRDQDSGTNESLALVQSLIDDGLLQPMDEHRFAFHPLLRSFLRQKLRSRAPNVINDLTRRAIARARAEGRWEDAFELAVEAGLVEVGADIVADAATEMLISGRTETLQNWLKTLEPITVVRPHLLVVKAEVLLRQGHQAEASALAREAAEQLATDAATQSCAWSVAGDAFHLVSDEVRALESHVRAKDLATNIVDRRRALWGAFNASLILESPNLEAYLDDLEVAVEGDVDTRLRVGTGRVLVKAHLHGTLHGAWETLEPLLAIEPYAQDPLARSVFLANAANVCVGRADYGRARDIAASTLDFCRSLHLDFATGFCLMHQVSAEIGLRHFREAKRTLAMLFEATDRHQDPFLALQARALRLKFALANQDFHGLSEELLSVPDREDLPASPYGELVALVGLAKAAIGELGAARELAKRARACTASVETKHFALLSDVVVDLAEGRIDSAAVTADAVLSRARQDQFLDAIVLGYRTSSSLLSLFAATRRFVPLLTELMESANDSRLAARVGLSLAGKNAADPAKQGLTGRETQVLSLLVQGRSNSEIANELVISGSTAKVHVHHVLAKLGAKSRLEAAAKGRAFLLDPE
jgi:LuxR family transcriptional regulator, maltose regulon positive regulatory protein